MLWERGISITIVLLPAFSHERKSRSSHGEELCKVLKFQKFYKKASVLESFFINLHASRLKLNKIGTPAEVFFREFCKIFENTYFVKTSANDCLLKVGFLKVLKSSKNLVKLKTKLLKMPGKVLLFLVKLLVFTGILKAFLLAYSNILHSVSHNSSFQRMKWSTAS